jgi:myo-inositol-1(or 4)-monophosphatase
MSGAERELSSLLALAMRLAREAGAIQRAGYEAEHEIATKSQAVDLVTEVDRACEAQIVQTLARERPHDSVLAEEGSGSEHPGATYRWVIDPLDGTTNYAHGYPRFAVSIALERDGAQALGVVYDALLDELHHAALGVGAFRNGRRIRVSAERELGRSLVATGFAYDKARVDDDNTREFRAFLKRAREVRRDGSAALDLCYVAGGRFDAFWEYKLAPWDVAAGTLIVTEAGGRVTDTEGGGSWRSGSRVLASNGAIHEAMLEGLAAARSAAPASRGEPPR